MKFGMVHQEALLTEKDAENEGTAAIWFSASRFLLIALLGAAPLALGAVELWAWTTLTLGVLLVLLLWTLGCLRQRQVAIAWSPVYIPAGLFLVFILFQFLTHQTLDFVATREALIKSIAYFLIFSLAGTLFTRRSRRWCDAFGVGVSIYVFVVALFAIIQFFSSPQEIYWTIKPRAGNIFGPYVNRNHYAGLMELLLPLVMGYFVSITANVVQRWLIGWALLIGFGSLVMCGSRGGLVSLLVQLLIFAAVYFRRKAMLGEKTSKVTVGIVLVVGALMAVWLVPEEVSGRVELLLHSPEITFADRKQMSLDALHIFREYPVFGTGLGSFEAVYPQYQHFSTDLVVDHAHNDYAEFLAETGILGGMLALAAFVALFWAKARGNVVRTLHATPSSNWISISALVSCCGLLVHSFVDFNLHIPANAAIFFALYGVAATSPFKANSESFR